LVTITQVPHATREAAPMANQTTNDSLGHPMILIGLTLLMYL
jgi:hypothetical protein